MDEESIFAAAIEHRSSTERSAFLHQACGGNEQLRRRVEALIRSHELAGSFLHEPAAPVPPATFRAITEQPGTNIGSYVLREQIGEGGMGVVYVAEQSRPVKRKVALKVIKPGMDTKQVIARFEAERQALALMDHPNIAKVLDAGSTDAGRPYFVMDLVRGLPITEYCDDYRLSPRERFELFVTVCHAVQHAHQKGIIHRDIKPSNILVTRNGDRAIPRVIDFGVAKAVNQRLTEQTIYTQFTEVIGTPLYMSPEQAELSELDVDTRSDVYSLGVVLYELLTGGTPIEMEKLDTAGYDEIRRIIRDEEPPRPSDRVSTLAAEQLSTVCQRRRSAADKYRQHLRGELDWIVMKALEKDPTRRYQSPASFAHDVQRYLLGEPIQARPASAIYRLRKFASRNKPIVIAATLVFAALIIGAVFSTWQAIRATTAYRVAAQETERAVEAGELAAEAQQRAESALVASRRAEAELALEKGQLLGERGDTNLALLWMNHALKTAPSEAEDLRRVILINISAWSQKIHPLRLMLQHEGRVDTAAYVSGQDMLLTASRVGNEGFLLHQWDVRSGERLSDPWRRTRGMVLSLRLDGAGRRLAAGYVDGRVELFDVATGEVQELSSVTIPGPITTLVFSPQGDRLLIAGGSRPVQASDDLDENSFRMRGPGLVQLLKIPSGKQVFAEPIRHEHMVWTAAFSPDGDAFVTESAEWLDANSSARTRFLSVSGKEIHEPLSHSSPALVLSLSPNGKKLLSGHWDNRARLWSLTNRDISLEQEIPCEGPVSSVAFHPHKPKRLLLGDYGGTARIWDTDAGRPIGPILWHRHLIRCARFSPDGEFALCGTNGGEIRMWGVAPQNSNESLSTYHPAFFPLDINHQQNRVLVQDSNGLIRLRDATTGDSFGQAIAHPGPVLRSAFSSEGDIVATIGADRVARVWDLTTGKILHELKYEEPAFSVAISPDGETVAVGCFADVAVLWDARTGNQKSWKLRHQAHSGPVFSVRYSPDGEFILTGGADSTARLWDVRSEREIKRFTQISSASGAEFSPNGSMIVICGGGEGARVWNVEREVPIGLPLRHEGHVSTAQFSTDGSMILTGGLDGAARLWDVATGRQLGPALRHAGNVDHVAFWPDGDTLVTSQSSEVLGSERGEIRDARYWRLPLPLVDSDEQIELWVQSITGMELGERGGMRFLDSDAWRAGLRKSKTFGSPHEAD